MKIHRNTNEFQFLTMNFCGVLVMTAALEILILTLAIYGGLR